MKNTTLCYIENDKDEYLLIYRNKEKNDGNYGKYIGIGGHIEEGETPSMCIMREIKEEAGITPLDLKYRAVISFVSEKYEEEKMHLFTSHGYEGDVSECDEGDLIWVKKDDLHSLPMWEGDYIFLDLIEKRDDFFELKLVYDKEDKLALCVLDGEKYEWKK